MGSVTGATPSTVQVTMTREVRWFRAGPLPPPLVRWFTNDGTLATFEHRIDRYDPALLHRGIGIKERDVESVDVKVLLRRHPASTLAASMRGHVEDWVKFSSPMGTPLGDPGRLIAVDKSLLTRECDGGGHGCTVELAAVTVAGIEAWSLCVEAFAPAASLDAVFREGIDRFTTETPLPPRLRFTATDSTGYPAWLGTVAAPRPTG